MKKLLSVLLIIYILFNSGYTAYSKQLNTAKLTTDSLTLIVKETYTLRLTNTQKIKEVKWSSEDKKVAVVNSSKGNVTAVGKGKTNVVCTFMEDKKSFKYKCTIIVKDEPKLFTNKLMAHALGGIDNKYVYTNTLEALEQSTEKKYKLIETDIILTLDHKLVCSHGWSQDTYNYTGVAYNADNPVMTYDEFMNTKIDGKYTTIDLSTIVNYMKVHKDVYFEFDLRTISKAAAIETTQKIIESFSNDQELLDRILIQTGSKAMYEGIDSVYHFKNYQYFLHDSEIGNIDSIIKWCKQNNILSVAIYEDVTTQKLINKFKQKGICVLIHTVDNVSEAKKFLSEGADVICTNFITYDNLIKH